MLKFLMVGPVSEEFSLEVHHGGFFIGKGRIEHTLMRRLTGLISVTEILGPLFG